MSDVVLLVEHGLMPAHFRLDPFFGNPKRGWSVTAAYPGSSTEGREMPTETYTDAIALLKADHRKVEGLFAKFESAKGGNKMKIAQEISTSSRSTP